MNIQKLNTNDSSPLVLLDQMKTQTKEASSYWLLYSPSQGRRDNGDTKSYPEALPRHSRGTPEALARPEAFPISPKAFPIPEIIL